MSQGKNWAAMMAEAQKGNAPVYNALLTEISRYLSSYLNFKLSSAADAQDVLQEILISVHRSRHTFDSKYPFKPWLFTITQSRLIEFWRRSGRRLDQPILGDEEVVPTLVAEAEISLLELQDLQGAFAKLSEQQRTILQGLRIEGKSVKDLAVELSMSVSAVKVAAHRAYKSVAEELGIDI